MSSNTADSVLGAMRAALQSQYRAGLAMLRIAIERCPEKLWADTDYHNPFWRVAYHVIYYTHLYSRPRLEDFTPWEHHQTGIQDLDERPAPEEIQRYAELPHRPPATGEPYTREQLLAYLGFCDELLDATVGGLDLMAPECGFYWYEMGKLEHQLVAIRHLQHHVGQLADRMRTAAGTGVDWVGSGTRSRRFGE